MVLQRQRSTAANIENI